MITNVWDILAKPVADWTDDEWQVVQEAIRSGEVSLKPKGIQVPVPPWRQAPTRRDISVITWPDAVGKGYIPVTREWDPEFEECAIARFFRDNPKATSVMMTCFCRRCSPQMSM